MAYLILENGEMVLMFENDVNVKVNEENTTIYVSNNPEATILMRRMCRDFWIIYLCGMKFYFVLLRYGLLHQDGSWITVNDSYLR